MSVTLHVCITCRAGQQCAEGETPLGAALFAALEGRLAQAPPPRPRLSPITCMANCERGCSAALAMDGKWTYLLGHLRPDHADDLLAYAASYAEAKLGTVMPFRRPASLAGIVMGRVPGAAFPKAAP